MYSMDNRNYVFTATPDNGEISKVEAALEHMQAKLLGDVKIFMIEDDQMIRELVITKLTQHGCIPFSTSDGNEALNLAAQFHPDVVILDLMLPGMTGEEILQAMKKDENLKNIPVVVFSNNSEEDHRKKMLELGADRYFIKAMTDLNELVQDLHTLAAAKANK